MSDEQTRRAAATDEDERMQRALQIHQRLMREYNWDYLGLRTEVTPPVPAQFKRGGEDTPDR